MLFPPGKSTPLFLQAKLLLDAADEGGIVVMLAVGE
jgi:hypothetical protein